MNNNTIISNAQWQNELKDIAFMVGDYLRQDCFPEGIQPDFLREAVRDYPLRGGKRLRPALLLWCCEVFNSNCKFALSAACALEVWHNWTLVHDDIIDHDTLRRGQMTTPEYLRQLALTERQMIPEEASDFGVNFAILAGDLQQSWAQSLLTGNLLQAGVKAEVVLAALQRLLELGGVELISGESLDVEFSTRKPGSVSEAEVTTMIKGKTAALLRCAAEIGAALGLNETNYQREEIQRLGSFAEAAGIAFQLQDDILGIFGDEAVFGKGIGVDLREGKATLLLARTLEYSDETTRQEFLNLLGREEYTTSDIEKARQIIRNSGALESVKQEAEKLYTQALNELSFFPEEKRQKLEILADYLIRRDV